MFCFYYRYLIHRKIDRHEKHISPGLSRHLHRCTACREYEGRMARLGAHMKESACGQLSDVGIQQVQTSVLNSLESYTAVRQPVSRVRFWGPYAVAAGIVIIAGLFGWLSWSQQHNLKAVTAANDAIASLNRAAAYSNSASLLNLLTEHSTQKEMNKLINNAQQAVTYLTNCIPQEVSNADTVSGTASNR